LSTDYYHLPTVQLTVDSSGCHLLTW